jgi:hypothetical protein
VVRTAASRARLPAPPGTVTSPREKFAPVAIDGFPCHLDRRFELRCRETPAVTEHGREDSELVKIGGKWLITRRYIRSDSGLPDRFDKTFTQRNNPLDWNK